MSIKRTWAVIEVDENEKFCGIVEMSLTYDEAAPRSEPHTYSVKMGSGTPIVYKTVWERRVSNRKARQLARLAGML